MTIPVALARQIALRDPRGLAELMRRLLQLEAARLNMALGAVNSTLRVTVADGGEDGVAIDVPEQQATRLPAGNTLFQFKTTGSATDLKNEMADEVGKDRPKAMLEAGGQYVVVWSQDATGQERDAVLNALKEAVPEDQKARVDVWPASVLEELCWDNPAIVVELSLAPIGSAQPFSVWAPGEDQEVAHFIPDPEREGHIEAIRALVLGSSDTHLFHLSGEAGVGKSRLIKEALDTDEIRDQVLVSVTSEGVGDFLNHMAMTPNARCVLVVDEVDPDELHLLRKLVGPALGRVRLITIGLPGRRYVTPQGNDFELGRLDQEALLTLLQAEVGLPEEEAQWVARISEGFPRLALAVAKFRQEVASASVGETLLGQGIDEVLSRMLGDEGLRDDLGLLSLFSSVGVFDVRESEINAIADAFERDAAQLRDRVKQEIGRFVSRGSRACSVTPLLVAAWLATAVLRARGAAVAHTIASLPPPLPDRFLDQLANFGEAPAVAEVVREILARQPGLGSDSFDQAAARFLQATAAITPQEAMAAVSTVLETVSDEDLQSDIFPRREVVWTLERLLWEPDLYRPAASALLRLAANETEGYANNASGILVDTFQIYLGGTLAPHAERLAWLVEARESGAGPPLILARAAAAGLRSHETRMHGQRVGATEPGDWRPATWEEELTARRGSLVELFAALDATSVEDREEVVKVIASSTRAALSYGLFDDFAGDVRAREWSTTERAALAESLRAVVRYDAPPEELVGRVIELATELEGDSLEERATVLLKSGIWDLRDEDQSATDLPSVLAGLVTESGGQPETLDSLLQAASDTGADPTTTFALFREYAARYGPAELIEAARQLLPDVSAPYAAALTVADASGEADRVTEELKSVANDESQARLLPTLVRATRLTEERSRLLLTTIESGSVAVEGLAELLYGAVIKELHGSATAIALIDVLATSEEPVAVEHAAGILLQFMEDELEADVAQAARELGGVVASKIAARDDLNPMAHHYLVELIRKCDIGEDSIWDILISRLGAQRGSLTPEEEHLILEQVQRAPEAASRAIFDFFGRFDEIGHLVLGLSRLNIFSALAESAGADEVWSWMRQQDERTFALAMRQLNWGREAPDTLTVRVLEEPPFDWVHGEASAAFFNAMGTVVGPFHTGYQRQLERARAWSTELAGGGAESWANDLVAYYESELEKQTLLDEEEYFERRQ